MLIPTYNKLFNPVIEAIKNLGGSAKNDEISPQVQTVKDKNIYCKKPLTKAERAKNVKKKDYLNKYSELCPWF